ncbi:PAAR domain-containing protein [Pseudomonas sp. S31]|uniref:PAAR domain-containing protein n=1 Tax=Pseudomonas sp. S31 TaxID=1564473 RepID=UPI001911AF9F|nr:PAAR domain-containing protein [Pseudomonas sp. S31]MBK4997895.1 PAAR domain-containing protein [Pseudomonas sp. S31]
MRVNIDGLGQAVDGDHTTTGAVCIATGEGYICEGRLVLRQGDLTTPCPLCGLEGRVAEGVWHFISDGQPVAVDGALVNCGCPEGTNRVVAPLGEMPPARQPIVARSNQLAAGSGSLSPELPLARMESARGIVQPGFYIVPRSMSFQHVLLELAEYDSTLPISYLRRLNPTFEHGFKAGEIFVIGDPDYGDACTREEGELMAAAEHARRALAALDFAESDFMMRHQAEIAGLLSDASQSMGVGKDGLEQGLKQVQETLKKIEQLHQREFRQHGHLNSAGFFAQRRELLATLDKQLRSAFLNKRLNLGSYERLRKSLNISTKSLVHHWSKAGAPGQIPGYATHLERVAKLGKYIKYGGYAAVGLGGASSYLKVQEVCRYGETEECKKIRLTEAGNFTGGVAGASAGAALTSLVSGTLCSVLTIGTRGLAAPMCGIVLVGGAGFAGSNAGAAVGEWTGETLYEATND